MKVEALKQDAAIQLKIGPTFYKRIQDLMFFFQEIRTPVEIADAVEKITKEKPLEGWEVHFETMLLLVVSIEDTAREQNLMEMIEIGDDQTASK